VFVKIMDVRTREVTAPDLERVVGATRRVPSEYPAATNRLIRWIYDGWRGEIGSWPRVNLACVRALEGGKLGVREGRQIDFLRDLCHYFLSGPLAKTSYTASRRRGYCLLGAPFFNSRLRFTELLARGSNTPRH